MSSQIQHQQQTSVETSNYRTNNNSSNASSGGRKRSSNRSGRSKNSNRGNHNSSSSLLNNKQISNGGNKWNRNGYGQAIEPTIGKFSADESATVKQAVEQYCQTHGVTPSRLCSESDNRTDHLRGAWMDIAKQLPHRTVQSVYRHGLRLMHPFKRGAWDEEETNELLILVTTHGKKWSEIQNKLNRSADSCRDKYREFHTNFTKGKWKEKESKELEMHVRKVLKVGEDVPLEELGSLVENESVNVPWSAISQKMKNRSRLSCFKRFQQITGIKKATTKKRKKTDIHADHPGDQTKTDDGSKKKSAPNSPEQSDMSVADTMSVAESTSTTFMTASVDFHTSVQEPIPDPTAFNTEDTIASYDRQLVHSLATSSYARETDVIWTSMNYPIGDAKERWNLLLEKWIEDFALDEDEVYDRPIWEVAKEMLNEGIEEVDDEEALMAARTVEAVFLC